jgi:hypothetical protein
MEPADQRGIEDTLAPHERSAESRHPVKEPGLRVQAHAPVFAIAPGSLASAQARRALAKAAANAVRRENARPALRD